METISDIIAEVLRCARYSKNFDGQTAVNILRRFRGLVDTESILDLIIEQRGKYFEEQRMREFIRQKTGWNPGGIIQLKD